MPHLETLLAQAGCGPDPSTGALVAPIHLFGEEIRAQGLDAARGRQVVGEPVQDAHGVTGQPAALGQPASSSTSWIGSSNNSSSMSE